MDRVRTRSYEGGPHGNDIRTRSYEGDPYGNEIRTRSYEAVRASSYEQLSVRRTSSHESVRIPYDQIIRM